MYTCYAVNSSFTYFDLRVPATFPSNFQLKMQYYMKHLLAHFLKAPPLLSRIILWPNPDIRDSSSGSILIFVSPLNAPLFALCVAILLYTCSYLKNPPLFVLILAWPRPFCYKSSHGPTPITINPHGPTFRFYGLILYCQESFHYVSPNVTCIFLSRPQYHCYMSNQDL